MKVIYIKIKQKVVVEEEKLNNTLLWFDMQTKKMHKFEGGKLTFKYDESKKKNIPQIHDTYVKKQKTVTNQGHLLRWIDQNIDDAKIKQQNADAYSISLYVDDRDYLHIIEKLQAENIEYDT